MVSFQVAQKSMNINGIVANAIQNDVKHKIQVQAKTVYVGDKNNDQDDDV